LTGATAAALLLAACSPGSEDASTRQAAGNEPAPSATAEVTPSEANSTPAQDRGTDITITAGDQTFKARLNNSKVARDFAQMLPVTLPWFRNATSSTSPSSTRP
jgi:hypothetical protein